MLSVFERQNPIFQFPYSFHWLLIQVLKQNGWKRDEKLKNDSCKRLNKRSHSKEKKDTSKLSGINFRKIDFTQTFLEINRKSNQITKGKLRKFGYSSNSITYIQSLLQYTFVLNKVGESECLRLQIQEIKSWTKGSGGFFQ